MTQTGITAKRLADRRFRKTEEAILKAFFEYDHYITINQMALRAGVARSTVYNHHHGVSKIIPNYEKFILLQYSRLVKKSLARPSARIKTLYIQTLSFILQRRDIFAIFIKAGNITIFEKMVRKLRPTSLRDSDKVLDIYTSEVAKLLFRWGQHNFDEAEFETVLRDILYLTTTARERLMPLAHSNEANR